MNAKRATSNIGSGGFPATNAVDLGAEQLSRRRLSGGARFAGAMDAGESKQSETHCLCVFQWGRSVGAFRVPRTYLSSQAQLDCSAQVRAWLHSHKGRHADGGFTKRPAVSGLGGR